MIHLEKTHVIGWEDAIRGMRNPRNSWEKSDSGLSALFDDNFQKVSPTEFRIGKADCDLMMRLSKGGPVQAKFRRMIIVYVDITAPLYWWKEFDTYKVGTVANSTSSFYHILDREFTLDDFSHEHLDIYAIKILENTVDALNRYRSLYVNYNPDDFEVKGVPSKKLIWWQMIQLLPSSYNQKRTIMLNYEVLSHIYPDRKDHKLDEWREMCDWIKTLPHSEIITLRKEEKL